MRKKIREFFWLDYLIVMCMLWFGPVFIIFGIIYIYFGGNPRNLWKYELIFVPLYLFSLWWTCNYDRFFKDK